MTDNAVPVLTVYLIFQFVKKSPKLLIYPGLVFNGASWQSAGAKNRKGNVSSSRPKKCLESVTKKGMNALISRP